MGMGRMRREVSLDYLNYFISDGAFSHLKVECMSSDSVDICQLSST